MKPGFSYAYMYQESIVMQQDSAKNVVGSLRKPEIGDMVICNGSGRYWVADYKGQVGKYIGPQPYSNTDTIELKDSKTISLYFDEYQLISKSNQLY